MQAACVVLCGPQEIAAPQKQGFRGLTRHGHGHGKESNIPQILAAIKQCGKIRDLDRGKELHLDALAAGIHIRSSVAANLITMYSKCRSMALARQVFDGMIRRDCFVWASLITGYVFNGESSVALDLFFSMDCPADSFTFVAALKACAFLAGQIKGESEKQLYLNKGIEIHRRVVDSGCDSDSRVASSLLFMYSKCGSMDRAMAVFNSMKTKDAVTWSSLIMGYVQNGESLLAMKLFSRIDCEPGSVTFIAALKACGILASEKNNESDKWVWLAMGIEIHKQIQARGFESEIAVANTLVDMYSKCGSMDRAKQVFDRIDPKTDVSWNVLMLGYVQNGESLVAMELMDKMNCRASGLSYVAALKACGSLAESQEDKNSTLERGISIHKQVMASGFESDIAVASTLVDMYSKCGSMDRARGVFDRMVSKDVVTWNSLMLGYVQNGESLMAMELLASMDSPPSRVSYVAALKACGSLAGQEDDEQQQKWREKGIEFHNRSIEQGFGSDIVLASTAVDMYCKFGSLDRARELFDSMVSKNVVTWNAMILGYVQNGEASQALDLFTAMDCEPDSLTLSAAIKACGCLASEEAPDKKQHYLEKGIAIHERAKFCGFGGDLFLGNNLIDMYSKCGSMDRAKQMFDEMIVKDVVSWTSIMLGSILNGHSWAAMDLFAAMDCAPNSVTLVAALKACGSLAALESGLQIHARICELGLDKDRDVASALIDFYGKCGSMNRAAEIFNNMQSPDSVALTSLIAGYSSIGDSARVLNLASEMQAAGMEMDAITFVCILAACSHAGLVAQGRRYFAAMAHSRVLPTVEHYNCLIDLLGRANRLHEALDVAKGMPLEANAITWRTLLSSCRKWKNVEIGRVAFDSLVAADGSDAAAFALMSEIYTAA